MATVVKNIIIQRKRRELEPMLGVLTELSDVEVNDAESREFSRVMKDLRLFSGKAVRALESLVKADSNWFFSTFLSMIR